jgi:hypothetical protein
VRIWGETLPEPLLVAPSSPLIPSPLATWWRWSSSPLRHGDCGSNLYQTLSYASLESHELSIMIVTIFCITYMVDIMFVRWFMRCKYVYVLDVWVDVYVTPFLFDGLARVWWSGMVICPGDPGPPTSQCLMVCRPRLRANLISQARPIGEAIGAAALGPFEAMALTS